MQGERRMGNPRTDAERRQRHKSIYGTSELPPRGTGRNPVMPISADNITRKIHGSNSNSVMMANQGASAFMSSPSSFNNPFASEKQRKYLYAKKPAVAKKLAKHK